MVKMRSISVERGKEGPERERRGHHQNESQGEGEGEGESENENENGNQGCLVSKKKAFIKERARKKLVRCK